jgi:hypothetical protein
MKLKVEGRVQLDVVSQTRARGRDDGTEQERCTVPFPQSHHPEGFKRPANAYPTWILQSPAFGN